MKSLSEFINEANETASPKPIYKVTVSNEYDTYDNKEIRIGDIQKLDYHYFSDSEKEYVYGIPSGKSWKAVLFTKTLDMNELNKDDSDETWDTGRTVYYTYDKEDAERKSKEAKTAFETVKKNRTSLDNLLKEINGYRPLKSVGFKFHIASTSSQSDSASKDSILVTSGKESSSSLRIFLKDNDGYIYLQQGGWHTYKIATAEALYRILKVYSENRNRTDDGETEIQHYGIVTK